MVVAIVVVVIGIVVIVVGVEPIDFLSTSDCRKSVVEHLVLSNQNMGRLVIVIDPGGSQREC